MAHEDKGKFFEKHPEGTVVAESLKEEILNKTRDNRIGCGAAEAIAGKTGRTMAEVGVGIDMLNLDIVDCQLGLFGYEGRKKVEASPSVPDDLADAIRQALDHERLSCISAWDIAARFGLKRMDVCAACEFLKIKVKPCQLGAF